MGAGWSVSSTPSPHNDLSGKFTEISPICNNFDGSFRGKLNDASELAASSTCSTLRVLQSFGRGFDGDTDFTDFFLAEFEKGILFPFGERSLVVVYETYAVRGSPDQPGTELPQIS